ncbi:MAG TPA: ATP-binding protein [Bacteroidia bacterium]|nr:ATP-binding protein [Bacteroidia bacterium]
MTGKVKIIGAFSMSLLVLVLAGLYAYRTAHEYKSSSDGVIHAHKTIAEAENILLHVQSIEAAQRGYVITGDEQYLQPHAEGVKNITGTTARLKELANYDQSQSDLSDSILLATKFKVNFANDVIQARKYWGFDSAQSMMMTGTGEKHMKKIRLLVRTFVNKEKALLVRELARAQANFSQTLHTLVASIVFAICIIVTTLFFFIRDHNRRLHSEEQLVESEYRMRNFLDSLPLGVFVMRLDGTPYYVNTTAVNILGKGIVAGADVDNITEVYKVYVAGTDQLYPTEILVRLLAGEKQAVIEDMEVLKEGKRIPLRVNTTHTRGMDGELKYAIAVFEDITDMREVQNRLMKAKKIAEESMALKEAFLANMSHEIRTPMNAIIGFTNLLLKRDLAGEEKVYVHTIKTSGENLLRIINDVLDVSKMESGMMTFENHAISISEIFSSLQAMLSPKAQEKHLALTFTCMPGVPPSVLGDPTRLTQILVNLAGNAIKFTEKGSVEVTASAISENTEVCEIGFSVKDSGIGIPEDKLQQIFDRFTQAESHTARHYGGTGLGLSIARQLVELQGGKIVVKSAQGIGSVFTFVLPFRQTLAEVHQRQKQESGTDPRIFASKRILLVEDNPINIKFVQSLFGEYGIKTDLAQNGMEAVSKVREKTYDIVLMDIEMPEMNGYEATTVIRDELRSTIPILAMTAHAMAGEREKCLQAGMNGYISKPINEELLFSEMFRLTAGQETAEAPLTNLDYLIRSMKGNKDAIRETIDIFLKHMPADLELLREAVENKDLVMIKRNAHRIKSTVSIAGAAGIAKILGDLEERASSKDINEIMVLYKALVPMTDQAISEMQSQRIIYNP